MSNDIATLEKIKNLRDSLDKQISKTIVGQKDIVEHLLISVATKGHVLLVGVPGLAKTLLIRSLSEALKLSFNRIQFTPDLMPSDITGTEIIEEDRSTGKKEFKFVHGPIFSQVILADEINRTPPKTQAALLQAMAEQEVSTAGQTFKLEEPFFVLATQNPIEQEGTYPLPEAQLDRFMMELKIEYPSLDEELEIISTTTTVSDSKIERVVSAEDILEIQDLVRRVPVSDNVLQFAVNLVRATRPDDTKLDFVKEWVRWGAGPRAGQNLILGAKAKALLDGRPTPEVEDIISLSKPVLRHRIVRTFRAEADGIETGEIIGKVVASLS